MAAFNADEYLADSAIDLSALSYSTNGVRRLPVSEELAAALRAAVTAVYGPDYRVDIMSAAQPGGPKGTPGTTGTRRHGTGVAADVWVYAPDGRKLRGDDLIPLSQHWLATNLGSVGFPANNNSLHLDLIGGTGPGSVPLGKGEGRVWYYGQPTSTQRSALNSALTKGTLPTYAVDPAVVAKGLIPPRDIPGPPVVPANKSALLSRLTSSPDGVAAAKMAGMPPLPRARPKPGVPAPAPRMTDADVASLYENILPGAAKPPLPQPPMSVADIYRGILPPSAPKPVPQPPMDVADVYRGIIPPPGPVAPSAPKVDPAGFTPASATNWSKFYERFGIRPPSEDVSIVPASLPAVPRTPGPTLPFPPSFPRATDPAWAGTRTAMSVTPTLRNGEADTSSLRPLWEGAGTLDPVSVGLDDTGLGSLIRPPLPDTRPRGPVNRGGLNRNRMPPIAPIPVTRPQPRAPIPATRTPIKPPTPMPASLRPVRRAPIDITVLTGSPPIPVPMPRSSRPTTKMSPNLRDWLMNGGDSSDQPPRERRYLSR